jgi:hypothetical protein
MNATKLSQYVFNKSISLRLDWDPQVTSGILREAMP